MNELLNASLLACDYFSAYQRGLVKLSRRTDKKIVKSQSLDKLYEQLAEQVKKVHELRKRMAESN